MTVRAPDREASSRHTWSPEGKRSRSRRARLGSSSLSRGRFNFRGPGGWERREGRSPGASAGGVARGHLDCRAVRRHSWTVSTLAAAGRAGQRGPPRAPPASPPCGGRRELWGPSLTLPQASSTPWLLRSPPEASHGLRDRASPMLWPGGTPRCPRERPTGATCYGDLGGRTDTSRTSCHAGHRASRKAGGPSQGSGCSEPDAAARRSCLGPRRQLPTMAEDRDSVTEPPL